MASTIIGRSSRPSRIGPSYCTIRLPSSACRVRPVRRSTPMGGAGICCCPHRLISCRAQQARITNNRTFYWGGIFMHAYTESIRVLFTGHADPQKAAPMKRYMRDQFEYLGIKGPEMGSLLKQHIREHGLPPLADLDPILRELWALPQREFQYAANGLLEKFEGELPPEFIETLEYLLVTKSWWDTVDTIATGTLGVHFKRHPKVRKKY